MADNKTHVLWSDIAFLTSFTSPTQYKYLKGVN